MEGDTAKTTATRRFASKGLADKSENSSSDLRGEKKLKIATKNIFCRNSRGLGLKSSWSRFF